MRRINHPLEQKVIEKSMRSNAVEFQILQNEVIEKSMRSNAVEFQILQNEV